ncbi:TetR/AcrR family transcriptional regulator [Bacteroides fragilis]|uniref:TetR/AcrR family transcriptional regulator n=1 Tax=Bacteroides fragilis TaxID=817 RepID=UPI001C7086D6|nr:TetR/AcrR family transcriptional regulator [Bacteroides fragilis]MBW9276482.1 TetR/AcrR family transcriptional regulator [Bacteroides fragilis]
MQTLKSDIRNRILSAAKEQFVQRGYLKTSMREIADAVDVGVGNLYNYFENKDELFCVILRPVSDALERMLQEHHGAKGADIMLICSEEYLKSAVDEYISLINKHGELMKILLFHSQGSSLEKFREDYTNRSTEIVKTWFAEMKEKHPEINVVVSDFMIHLQAVWMFTLFEEMLKHAIDSKEMEYIVHEYILFEIQGWRALLRV